MKRSQAGGSGVRFAGRLQLCDLALAPGLRPWTPEAGPLLLAPSPSQQRRQLASELTSAQASLLCFPCSVLSECLAGGTEV